jgi:TetR/AcrR family transcriptional repressor of nem operon
MTDTREVLLDAAEDAVRLRGYHAVSFRELADTLGIKSSSVHYYFRQKEDLGLALVERYEARFFAAVDAAAANAKTPDQRVKAFGTVYRSALQQSDRICLCGMLGAESAGLPPALAKSVANFFQRNIDWLADALPPEITPAARQKKARHAVAALQGAMMLAASLDDHKVFDSALQDLQQTLTA